MIRCVECILPSTFPGIELNEDGVCNFCVNSRGVDKADKQQQYASDFMDLVEKYRGINMYDAIVCFSGGKDSTYTMYMMKEKYGLNILAFTMDNGFVSPRTTDNIRIVLEAMNIDHMYYKPRFDILKRIFAVSAQSNIYSPKAIERASVMCTSCMNIIKFGAMRLALDYSIPMIIYGWSPGQAPITSAVMRYNPSMMELMQKVAYEPLHEIIGDEIRPYILDEKYFSDSYQYPYNVIPLLFMEYDEEAVYEYIESIGWIQPEDTDANSSNCLLNSFGIRIHKEQYGFHPYVQELANMVRDGYITRDTALERINRIEDTGTVELVMRKLDLL